MLRLPPKGRELYGRLLGESTKLAVGLGPEEADALAIEVFKQYPDDWTKLRKQGLIYCEYRCAHTSSQQPAVGREEVPILEQLISKRLVEVSPITYEDFLLFSAAGIFQSNLQSGKGTGQPMGTTRSSSNQKGLEKALGMELLDLDNWYASAQRQSLEIVSKELGFALGDLL